MRFIYFIITISLLSCQEVDPSKHMFYYLSDTKPYTFYENGVVETWNQGAKYYDVVCKSKGSWKLQNDEIVITGIYNNNCPGMEDRNGRFIILGKISESSDNHYIKKVGENHSKAKIKTISNKDYEKNTVKKIEANHSIRDLVNYVDYISEGNGRQEKLSFRATSYEVDFQIELTYTNSDGKEINMNYNGDTIFFKNNPQEKYLIKNISNDLLTFSLQNPDGTIQLYRGVQH